MSHRILHSSILALAVFSTPVWAAPQDTEAKSFSDSARLDTYLKPDGSGFFALSLSPEISPPPAETAHDVVVLFDTSASQTGEFREKSLIALRALVANCSAQDRVHLIAVDLSAAPMTPSFTRPDSPEFAEATKKLERRVPLGATDLPLALQAAIKSFPKDSSTSKAVIYIGDGVTAANFLVSESFAQLTNALVAAQLPLTSYAIGPRTDSQLLAALANQTGGMLVIDGTQVGGKQAGIYLSRSIHEEVFWPSEAQWPQAFEEVYPRKVPPLRSDRDTIVLGKGKPTGAVEIDLTGRVSEHSAPIKLHWTAQSLPSNEDFAYLATLVEAASKDQGATLATVGTAGLKEIGRLLMASVESISQLGSQAAATGNFDDAERLADEALRRDPRDQTALAVKRQIAKARAGDAKAAAELSVHRSTNEQAAPPPAASTEIPPAPAEPAPPSILDDTIAQNRLVESMIRAEVESELKEARATMATHPASLQQSLKLSLERVLKAPELSPEVRAQLSGQIRTALREANRRAIEKDQLDIEAESARASAEERLRIVQALEGEQEKVKQLMDRFDSLMQEGQYLLAEEAAAAEAQETAPNLPVTISATLVARTTRYTQEALATRIARQKGVVDTLAQCEFSHIPFPDDQPIVYPDAKVWEDLSIRRKKWKEFASADPKDQDEHGATYKIHKALDETTDLSEFIEAPLSDVVDYLSATHNIPIQLDTRALEDASIGPDTTVTPKVKGISLRSALRLMLGTLDLTYVIKNEVLLITTPEQAANELTTKVYPVADLVIPVTTPMMGMGGMGMMGRGMMGGGMGGMGMGGMGGGMF